MPSALVFHSYVADIVVAEGNTMTYLQDSPRWLIAYNC